MWRWGMYCSAYLPVTGSEKNNLYNERPNKFRRIFTRPEVKFLDNQPRLTVKCDK